MLLANIVNKNCQNFVISWPKNAISGSQISFRWHPLNLPVRTGGTNVTTKMVVASCMFNIHKCMIHYINQNVTADVKMYHTWLYAKCTMIYDHICTQFWRSVSTSGHGNTILKLQIWRPGFESGRSHTTSY